MAKKKLKPVSIAGIEFDALIDSQTTMNSTVPAYAVESGFPVSDTIILEPMTIQMTLYVSNTPVTWLYRHGNSSDRVKKICNKVRDLWKNKKLVKIVTMDAIYTNMALTEVTISKSKDIGYAREISVTAQKVTKTTRKTVKVPNYSLKSGKTKSNAGSSATSSTSSKSSGSSGSSSGSKSSSSKSGSKSSSKGSSKNGSSSKNANSKKSASILYGAGKGLGLY